MPATPASPLLARWEPIARSSRSLIVDPDGTRSYGWIDARARAVAEALLRGRFTLEGARVAMLVEPGAEFIAAFLGTLLAGGCAVVLSPLHPPSESAYFLQDSQATSVLASRAWRNLLPPAAIQVLELEGLAEAPSDRFVAASAGPGDPALQLYTSGTTGRPKGAVLTHANLGVQQALLSEAWGLSARDTLLHVLPLHHMHGLCIALLSALGVGAGVRFRRRFDAAETWEAMAESSVFMAVPTIYSKLLDAFDAAGPDTQARWRAGASRLRLATSGSAALPVSLAARWSAIAGRIPLERFGMTEVGVALSNPLDGDRREGTVGLPLPGVEARIVGEGDSETGELWLAGPSVFSGYHGREDATRAAFAEPRWFRTGDTVTRDERGYFRVLGRTSVDILKSGGYKLSALEIEEALREHAGIAEVAVVGIPDETWGDRVVACVVMKPDAAPASETSIRDFARARMASYKVPKQVFFLSELPRNALGKVIKPELAKRVGAHPPRIQK